MKKLTMILLLIMVSSSVAYAAATDAQAITYMKKKLDVKALTNELNALRNTASAEVEVAYQIYDAARAAVQATYGDQITDKKAEITILEDEIEAFENSL